MKFFSNTIEIELEQNETSDLYSALYVIDEIIDMMKNNNFTSIEGKDDFSYSTGIKSIEELSKIRDGVEWLAECCLCTIKKMEEDA